MYSVCGITQVYDFGQSVPDSRKTYFKPTNILSRRTTETFYVCQLLIDQNCKLLGFQAVNKQHTVNPYVLHFTLFPFKTFY